MSLKPDLDEDHTPQLFTSIEADHKSPEPMKSPETTDPFPGFCSYGLLAAEDDTVKNLTFDNPLND